jgi:hypothetical protein
MVILKTTSLLKGHKRNIGMTFKIILKIDNIIFHPKISSASTCTLSVHQVIIKKWGSF